MNTTTVPGAGDHQQTTTAAVSARGVRKIFGTGQAAVVALDDVSAVFARGSFTAIMGPSGSGKSTFMHCLAGLDTVDGGSVAIGETSLTGLNDNQITALRRDRVGFVFQSFNLFPTLTARQNITLPPSISVGAESIAKD